MDKEHTLGRKVEQYQLVISKSIDDICSLIGLEELNKAIQYALIPGGKRLRPVLSCLFYEEIGGEDLLSFVTVSSAIEILHSASLIHDDLPSLDNDDMRRGRESVHKKFSEGLALLSGDAMVALALKIISEEKRIDVARRNSIVNEISGAFFTLCEGQAIDLLDKKDLFELHSKKTGALFGACFSTAAVCVGFSKSEIDSCRKLGVDIGIAYQFLDDFIDMYGSDDQRGRIGSSDSRKQKTTFFRGNKPKLSDWENLEAPIKKILKERKLANVEAFLFTKLFSPIKEMRKHF